MKKISAFIVVVVQVLFLHETAAAASTEAVVWTDQRNTSVSGPAGSTLAKTGSTPGWNAGAMSTKAIGSGDGHVEFSIDQANTTRTIGLSHREPGERVLWRNLVKVGLSGDLTKTGATAWGNAGASSVQTIAAGDGFVEFSVKPGTHRMCGLSRVDASQAHTEIEFALYTALDGRLYVFESGVDTLLGTYVAGDRFRVAVESGIVRYRKNGDVIRGGSFLPHNVAVQAEETSFCRLRNEEPERESSGTVAI